MAVNLYSFATKELAQDATLAYILAWAHPDYCESHPLCHELGTVMLRALLSTVVAEDLIPEVEALDVKTQFNRIDVLATINIEGENGLVLLIEDKVDSDEHADQINRYITEAENLYPGQEIVPVVVKTGNISRQLLPPEADWGRFMRGDLLNVLNQFRDLSNTIFDNFREYLQNREDVTNSYINVPFYQWDENGCMWMRIEGFYSELENRMTAAQDLDWDWWGWDYAYNPAGGILWFAFGEINLPGNLQNFQAYLQIEDARRLTLRVTGEERVTAPLMYEVLERLARIAEEVDGVEISKAGRFSGGNSAAVAEITFNGEEIYLALTAEGIVDMDATMERLNSAMELVQNLQMN